MANPYFNAAYYLATNADVFAAGITLETAEQHYLQYGADEAYQGTGLTATSLREPAPWFDIQYYFGNNPDLIANGVTPATAFQHFTTYGISEGRSPAPGIELNAANLGAYAAGNQDLIDAFGIDDPDNLTAEQQTQLAQQYYQYGYNEARPNLPADPDWAPDDVYTLTVGQDNIVGNSGDNVFTAPVVSNMLGQVVNTLETGDKVDGGGGFDTLNVTLTNSQGVDSLFAAPAISATISNVEVINVRAQYFNRDLINFSDIDAELHSGVEQYWSDNSRGDLQIEDVRQLPEELTFGMRQTDVGSDYSVYFDQAQLAADRSTSGDSSLTLTLVDNTAGAVELENFPVNGIVFKLGGTEYTVQTEAALGATYVEFADNLQAALAADADLADITVVLNPNDTITLVDPEGEAFEAVGYTWVGNVVPSDGNLQWNMTVGAAVEDGVPVTTNVILDAVGRTSQGGVLDIGSMDDGGIAVFNVEVDRDSWVTRLDSREDFGSGDRHLETVNLTSIGANGDVTIGNAVSDTATGALDGRVVNGLINVREVLNQGFAGDMTYGVRLTNDSITRYLDDADDTVQFTYEGGDGNDNVTIVEAGSSFLSGDVDFAMNVDLGAGDDRLNLAINNASNVSVDGGEGDNTIAVARSHGTTAANTFADFANFQTYEVEGSTTTGHDFASMQGVTAINIATTGVGTDTTLTNVAPDTEIVITGKNQTLGSNSNNHQFFGEIEIDSDFVLGGDDTLRVTLQNTARLDARLRVDKLFIGDNDGDADPIRTLDLVSAGSRDTFNAVFDLDAALVNTFNLTGTQDLFIDITAAANSTAAAGQRDALVVDGSELSGTLDLDITGAIVNAVNAASKTVTLTGTGNDDDVLGITGALNVTNNTAVNAFETVEFWDGAQGTVNLTNFNDVGLYRIVDTNNDLELTHMKGNEKVWVDADATSGDTLTFIAAAQANTNVLDIEYQTTSANVTVDIEAQDFRTIQLDLGGTAAANAYTINLDLLDEDGNPFAGLVPPVYDPATVYARSLVVTGGGDDVGVDSVNLGTLDNILSSIDLSDYVGRVELAVDNMIHFPPSGVPGRNVTIELNAYSAELTELNAIAKPPSSHNIVTYKFTTDLIAGETVKIAGFEGNGGGGGVPVNDVSILDMRDLDITGLADLSMAETIVGGVTFTTITSNGDHDFKIELEDISIIDLNNENFMFAA